MSASMLLHHANRAHTRHHHGGAGSSCPPYANLIIAASDGSDVTIFGPPSAMEAFDRAAAIIQEALRPVDVQEAAE